MFINYEPCLNLSRQFTPSVWKEKHAKFPAQNIPSKMQKGKGGYLYVSGVGDSVGDELNRGNLSS